MTLAIPPVLVADADGNARADLGTRVRALTFTPASWNAEARTIDVTWTTGAQRTMFDWERWDYVEEALSTEAGAVRLDRLNRGAPVLNGHASGTLENQIGAVVEGSARIEGGIGTATLILSPRESIAGIVADIASGIIRNISVGYIVHRYQVTEEPGVRPVYLAVDWEPVEISFVPVPADAACGVRSDARQGGNPCIISRAIQPANVEAPMPDTAPAAAPVVEVRTLETPPAAAIVAAPPAPAVTPPVTGTRLLTAARNAGLDADAIAELQTRHAATPLTEGDLMADIGARFANRDQGGAQRTLITIGEEGTAKLDREIEAAYLNRMNPKAFPLAAGNAGFRGLSMVEIGREYLSARGIPAARMPKHEVADMLLKGRSVHTTSDFAGLLGNIANKALRMPLVAAPQTFESFVFMRTIRDFKPFGSYQLGDGTGLTKVNEAGEFKYGTIGATGETYALETVGKIFALSRQAIINDDLGAFDTLPMVFENLKRTYESDLVYGILSTNAALADTVALFHATHANLAASGSAISLTSLGVARAAMAKQTAPNGQKLNIMPATLLVGPDKQTEAEQFVSPINANIAGSVNPFAGKLTVAVDARVSGTNWYLFTNPNAGNVATIELAHLEGEENGTVETRAGFEVDGMEFKVRLDTNAKAIDYRGMYKNPGA